MPLNCQQKATATCPQNYTNCHSITTFGHMTYYPIIAARWTGWDRQRG